MNRRTDEQPSCILESVDLQSVIFFETQPKELFARVFTELRPRTAVPAIRLEFCKFANANSFSVRWDEDGLATFRITDVLRGCAGTNPRGVGLYSSFEAIAPPDSQNVCRKIPALSKSEGNAPQSPVGGESRREERKYVSSPQGDLLFTTWKLIFEELNLRYFHGLVARPLLGWSRKPSRTMLGHYDPSHNAIVLSKHLDRASVARLAVEYVMFHEMLHLRFPVEHRGARRCVHTAEFKQAEKEFIGLKEAKELLKRTCAEKASEEIAFVTVHYHERLNKPPPRV